MKFKAKEVFTDYDENNVLIIGFSGVTNELGEPIYFMIQDSEEYDMQDKQLGIDTYYIEKNDQSIGGYGGIKELTLDMNRIRIDLDKKGIENLKETKIEIEFDYDVNVYNKLKKRLNQIFSPDILKTTYNAV